MYKNIRRSTFLIPIENNSRKNKQLFVHGYTGGVDLIDTEIARILIHKNLDLETINSKDIEYLLDRGYLTLKSRKEELTYVAELVDTIFDYYKKQLTVLIAPNLDCSFRCTYCFQRDMQNTISKNASSPLTKLMDKKQVDKLYSVLDDKTIDPNCKLNREITLYGGEALQNENKEIINYIVTEGVKRGFHFSAISNGYEIDEFYNLFGKGGLRKIQITIDGFEDMHDKMRVEKKGNKSFYKIIENIENGLDKGCVIDLAFNFNETNIDNISKLLRFFKNKGWTDRKDIVIHGNQIFDLKTNLTAFQENYDEIIELRELAKKYNIMLSNSTTKIRELFKSRLDNDLPLPLKPSYCSANTGMYIFAPDNHLYACWEAVGDSISKVGTYYPEYKVDSKMMDRWKSRVASRIDECHQCEFVMFCGGGCTINAYRKNGTFLSPYCDSFEKKFTDLMNNIIIE